MGLIEFPIKYRIDGRLSDTIICLTAIEPGYQLESHNQILRK